eukprot:TRINITY_DN980_c0_g4_i3.p1 TRINITY_DN980_c0_g4~~TRINITY_DN980_c0_g4_i3.p1  ORF type:complete len:2938 (+),score=1123.41 TRINITY_DN980_c0_g4_i3:984-8816(+)
MAAVGRSEEQMRAAIAELGLGEDLDIAAVNAPQSVTVSGRAPAVEKVREWCAKGEVYFKMLDIPRAYHSRFTAPCRDAFLESFRAVRPKSAAVPFFSTVEGKQRTAPLDATYWWSNISSAVRFWPALQAMQEKCAVVMEVSAHSVLRQYCLEHEKLPYVHCLRRGKDDVSEFLKSLAFVFCKGVQVSWEGAGRPRDWNVDVPPMPWNNKPFRIGKFAEDVTTRYSGGPLASSAAPAAAVAAPATASDKYTMTLHRNTYGYVHHHVVKGAVVVPGAMYISLGLELPEGKGASVCDMEFRRMLTWSKADETLEITMLYDGESFSVMKGGVLHAKGRRALRPHPAPIDEGGLAAAERRCTTAVDPAAIYRTCAKFVDFDLDRRFQTVAAYYVGDGERLVHIPAPEDDLRLFHPAVMDACFQGLGYVTGISADPIVPTSLGQLTVLTDTGRMPHEPLRCHVRVKSRTPDSLTADIDVFTVPGVRVAAVRDFTMSAAARSSDPSLQLITVRRQPRRLPDLPVPELPEGAADEERHAALAAAARAAVDSGRVVRVLSSAGALAAAKAADPALLEPGRAVWHTAPAGGDYDLVCTEADEAAVRACLAPGGYGLLQGGGVVRGAAAEGAVRRCKVLGADPALAELAAAHPGQVGPEVADPEIVFDARGDLVAASALIRDYARKDAAPALAFVVRDAPELWGFTRCARNEFPGLSIVAVESDAAAISAAARLTAFPDCELYAGGAVPRITNAVPAPAPEDDPASAGDYRVQIDRVGQLNTLGYARIDRAQEGCGADEVRLDVRAVGVNFKDVVVAMGLLSGFSPVFGLECAGVVSALGEQAARQSGLKVGDAVLAACFTPAGARDSLMGTTAVAKWHNVVPAPKGVDLAAAAGFPLVMATAYQSLTKLAQLESDETVLIHSATGGVGQAAIQLAKRAGAKVIGSAGTPEKRKRLVEELGCDHAIDSHDPTCFVKEVMAFTEGRGCDVVLNSLSGAAQAESMRCLAPGGRFVEIGKVDMQQNSVIRQGLLQQNISFFSFHLDLLGRTHPAKAQRMLREVVQLLEKGELRPVETEVAPLSAAASVLQRMSRGEHQGKIVLQVEEGWAPERPRPSAAIFRRDASYLFTGATRGVGLHAAAWAVQQGARRIILTGSTGRAPRHSELLLRGLRQRVPDLEYRVLKLDLADPAAVSALFEAEPSIRGVFHFATQYTSETSDSVTTDTVRGGLAVKAHGAKALHEATKGRDIDIFFMASSLAGLVGNQNQAMYSAANGYLQWLAAERRRLGLPGVALDLPAIIGAGRLSEFEHAMELEILVGKGVVPVAVGDVCKFIGKVLSAPEHYPAHVTLDAPQWARVIASLSRHRRLYEHHPTAAPKRKAARRAAAAPQDTRSAVLSKLAFMLETPAGEVDMSAPLTELGVDSLAAVELMNWLNSDFGVSVPQTDLLGGLSGAQLAERVAAAGPAAARGLRSPPRDRSGGEQGAAAAAGLPPLKAEGTANQSAVLDALQRGRLSWRVMRGSGMRPCLAVHTDEETLQLRELAPRRAPQWPPLPGSADCGAGVVRAYCRATLGGAQKARGWLGVGSGCFFFVGDAGEVEVILRPSEVVEIVRDDELSTVDVRYCDPVRRAAVFAVPRVRLEAVVGALCAVCDETRPAEASSGRPAEPADGASAGERGQSAFISPPRGSVAQLASPARYAPPSDGRGRSAERDPAGCGSPARPARLAPSPRACDSTPHHGGSWALAPPPGAAEQRSPSADHGPLPATLVRMLPAGLEVSDGINRGKWASTARLLGCGAGVEWQHRLRALAHRLLTDRSSRHADVIDELLGRLRVPQGVTAVAVLAEQARRLHAAVADFSESATGLTPLDLIILRLHSQEGPDVDRLMGFPDAPLPMGQGPPQAWAEYSAQYLGRGRNVALFPGLAEAMCSAAAAADSPDDRSGGWAQLACYLAAAPHHVAAPGSATLYRPAPNVDPEAMLLHRALHSGQPYSWAAPASCTRDQQVAEDIIAAAQAPRSIMFRIYNAGGGGLPVQCASQYPLESEVLLPPLASFTVDGVFETQRGLFVDLSYNGSLCAGDTALLRALGACREEAREANNRLVRMTACELSARQEQSERRRLADTEHTERRALEQGLYLLDLRPPQRSESPYALGAPPPQQAPADSPALNGTLATVAQSYSPHRSPGRRADPELGSPRPPQYDDARAAAAAFALPIALAEAEPGDEAATLRDASRLINFLSDRVRELEWQLDGMRKLADELRQQQQQSYVEEVVAERNRLIAERDQREEAAQARSIKQWRQELMRRLPEEELRALQAHPEELAARFVVLQREFQQLQEESAARAEAVQRACRDRARDEVREELARLREQAAQEAAATHRGVPELCQRVAALVAENRMLSGDEDRVRLQNEIVELRHRAVEAEASLADMQREAERKQAEEQKCLRAAELQMAREEEVYEVRRATITRMEGTRVGIIHNADDWRLVEEVEQGSPAHSAGITPGATLLRMDDKELQPGDAGWREYLEKVNSPEHNSFQLEIREAQVDQRPATQVRILGEAIRGYRKKLMPAMEMGGEEMAADLHQNALALDRVWGTLDRNVESLRQLYLFRRTLMDQHLLAQASERRGS